MSFSKFFPIALFIGFQCIILQSIDQLLSPLMPPVGNVGFGWIAFQAWAMYFLAGCNLKDAARTFFGYGIGILGSIAIFLLAGKCGMLGFMNVPVVLAGVVTIMILLERAPTMLNFVPAFFVGAGAYFGFMSYIPGATFETAAFTELVYCLLGLASGYTTVTFRVWYESTLKGSDTNKAA